MFLFSDVRFLQALIPVIHYLEQKAEMFQRLKV
jgi:hypothetical protein